jgi:glycosyltransferase A (GT-A) superfamily protein (DUF2064 family)
MGSGAVELAHVRGESQPASHQLTFRVAMNCPALGVSAGKLLPALGSKAAAWLRQQEMLTVVQACAYRKRLARLRGAVQAAAFMPRQTSIA